MLSTWVKKWFVSVIEKILEDPLKNVFVFSVSAAIVYYMAKVLYNSYGFLALIGYIFACLYGATKIIDEPRRSLMWGVGYFFAATTTNIFFEMFVPEIKGETATSSLAAIVILYVIAIIWFKSRELKNY